MDPNLHANERTENHQRDIKCDGFLLDALVESVEELQAARSARQHRPDEGAAGREEGRRRGGVEAERGRENRERECKKRVLRALRELSVFHSERVTAWRGACEFTRSPAEGAEQLLSTSAELEGTTCSDSFSDALKSVGEDVRAIQDKLRTIIRRLDAETIQSSSGEASDQDTRRPEISEQRQEPQSKTEEGDDPSCTSLLPEPDQTSDSITSSNSVEESGKKPEIESPVDDKEEPVCLEKDTGKETRMDGDEGKAEAKSEWITVGLAGGVEDAPDACFVRTLADAAEVLRCEAADAFSCFMVAGSEELVSRVIRVRVREGATLRFPLTLAVPFRVRYRSNYRDVAVKIVDDARRASYVTPVTAEGSYGGKRGTLAQVRVYSLGLFAVVSCLKRENYTVPSRGSSLKLSTDSRISLNYLPGSFTASVIARVIVQPVDALLLSAVKSRSEAYHPVVSTSPLLYLTHPASQPLRRPLSLTLPCPPNPERKRNTKGRNEENELHHSRSGRSTPPRDPSYSHSVRISKSSKETSRELLLALGHRDKHWSVLENVKVKNQQNGVVSLELAEKFDRLLVLRLLSPVQLSHVASLAEELEESVCGHAVAVVLHRRRDEPRSLLVAALPSRELAWEQNRPQADGELLETSPEFSMREGDQLLLRFSGNVTSVGCGISQSVTFHCQRRNQLLVGLTEVDPFGNHSSPHYKGAVAFYRVPGGQRVWGGDQAVPVNTAPLDDPICKLPLTLPKRARNTHRPSAARLTSCEATDSLSDALLLWLSGELSEEDLGPLVLSLRLRRSTTQLVKLRAGASLSAQAFHVLALWRRGLPAALRQHRASQLAQGLAKSGRPDLARELLLRQDSLR